MKMHIYTITYFNTIIYIFIWIKWDNSNLMKENDDPALDSIFQLIAFDSQPSAFGSVWSHA